MKTKTFLALAAGLCLAAILATPASAQCQGGQCPAFTIQADQLPGDVARPAPMARAVKAVARPVARVGRAVAGRIHRRPVLRAIRARLSPWR